MSALRILHSTLLVAIASLAALQPSPATAQDWGGPDAGGYQWGEIDYDFFDISGLGTAIEPVLGEGDWLADGIDLGFTFSYYGTAYDTVYIDANGFLSFTADLSPVDYGGFTFSRPTRTRARPSPRAGRTWMT